MSPEDLRNRFYYHPPLTDRRKAEHSGVRERCLELAEFLYELLPEGCEKSLAVNKLEEAMFWANAALARQQ